jgi:hypothetical protein
MKAFDNGTPQIIAPEIRAQENVPSRPHLSRSRNPVATRPASRTLFRCETTDEANMPFLFWMPMIVMCGLWRAAEEDTRALFPPPH